MEIPSNVTGLTTLEGPANHRMSGSKFVLPPSFDATKYASKWVEQGPQVTEAGQPQVLAFANCQAEGWAVFKSYQVGGKEVKPPAEGEEESDDKKRNGPKMMPFTRAVGKAVYVLLYRPKALQQAVNVLYANQSREMVGREVMGETASVNSAGDHGILTNADLRKFGANFADEMPEGYLPKTNASAPKPAEATELQLG